MSKIKNDKYYTSPELAQYIVNKTKEVIGEENITEYLEPSAGAGVFLDYLDKPYLAYDIEPEDKLNRIKKQDYLTVDLEYKKGRCIIGNPPFGTRGFLAVKFFKKAIHLCDYIAFVLPIGQRGNMQKMYEFDLIYSQDLGIKKYSGINKRCCFNIYKRPQKGLHKSPPKHDDLKDIKVVEVRRGSTNIPPKEYDFGMCTWGNGSCGKQIKFQGQYAQEHYIIVKNKQFKEQVIKLCNETDWKNLYPSISSAKLQTWQIYKYIKEQIPEIN